MQQRGDIQQELIEIANALEQADLSLAAGHYSEAAVVYKQAYMLLEHAYGVNDPDTIACLQKLGDMYYMSGRYNDALPVYKRLLAIGSALLGTHHPDVLAMQKKVGNTIELIGGRQAAEEMNDGASRLSHSSISALRLPRAQALTPPPERMEDADHWTDEFPFDPDVDSDADAAALQGSSLRRPTIGRAEGKRKAEEKPKKDKKQKSVRDNGRQTDELRRPTAAPGLRGQSLNPRDQLISFIIGNGGGVASLIVVIVLAVFGCIVMGKLNQQNGALNAANHAKAIAGRFKSSIYATADDARELILNKLNDASMKYPPMATTLVMPVVRAGPDWAEFFAVAISCLTKKDLWLEETPFGLKDEDGVNYYLSTSNEFGTASEMRRVAANAQNWFMAGQVYPQDPTFGQAFRTDKVEAAYDSFPLITVVQLMGADTRPIFADTSKGSSNIIKDLQNPAMSRWATEQPLRPGAIHCLSIKRGDLTPPTYQFYMQGCDRNGQLLTSSLPGAAYLIAYDQGKAVKVPKASTIPASNRLIRLCIATLPPGFSLRLVHCIFPLVLVSLSLFIIVFGHLSKPKTEIGWSWGPADLFALIMIMLGAFWGFFLLVAP